VEADYFYYTLMLIPMLAGRSMAAIFSSAFIAYLAKEGYLVYDIFELQQLAVLTNLPEWVTDPKFLFITFILYILEKNVSQSPSFQEFWTLNEAKIKGVFACVISALLVDENIEGFIRGAFATADNHGDIAESTWLSFGNIWAAIIGFFTWMLAAVRSSVMFILMEIDHDDSLGIRKFLGHLEGSLGLFGPLLYVTFPIAALIIAGFAFAIIAFLKWRVRKLEKKHQQPCPQCEHANHMSALHCGNCSVKLTDVKDVGVMGLSKMDSPAKELSTHIQKLRQVNRCPNCASSGNGKGLSSKCESCEQQLFSSREEAEQYLRNLHKRIPLTILVTSACGFFPIMGLIPGIIFYRLYLVGGVKIYVHHSSSFFIRIVLRIFFVLLIMFNLVPFFGFVSIPIMAMANYVMYSSSVRKQIHTLPTGNTVQRVEPQSDPN
jgi:ribosomal protein S27AE